METVAARQSLIGNDNKLVALTIETSIGLSNDFDEVRIYKHSLLSDTITTYLEQNHTNLDIIKYGDGKNINRSRRVQMLTGSVSR